MDLKDLDLAIQRGRQNTIPEIELLVPPTVHSEMYRLVMQDNRLLVAEVDRLRQQVADLHVQRRIENIRELESQFPRKGRLR